MVLNGEVLQSAKKTGHSFFARCLAGTFAGEDPIGSHVACSLLLGDLGGSMFPAALRGHSDYNIL